MLHHVPTIGTIARILFLLFFCSVCFSFSLFLTHTHTHTFSSLFSHNAVLFIPFVWLHKESVMRISNWKFKFKYSLIYKIIIIVVVVTIVIVIVIVVADVVIAVFIVAAVCIIQLRSSYTFWTTISWSEWVHCVCCSRLKFNSLTGPILFSSLSLFNTQTLTLFLCIYLSVGISLYVNVYIGTFYSNG